MVKPNFWIKEEYMGPVPVWETSLEALLGKENKKKEMKWIFL